MHIGEELIKLGVLLLIAYGVGRLVSKIGLPAIPVYIGVGLLASPHVKIFPISVGSHSIELIAVFGLILLLFSLGLEFDQDDFYQNKGKLLLSGGSYILINMAVGLGYGFLMGWGSREALVVAGITATSSSAIVTKLLISLQRLANEETPMILGVTVVEDIFIAIYLAIVSVVLDKDLTPGAVVIKLVISFAFIVAMFAVARYAGGFLSKILRTKDGELFAVGFFALAILFGGIGEELGVTDAIGAFLIGLILGATVHRERFEQIALPIRDVFGAFFFVNFGLTLDPATFGSVLWPVIGAIVMTFTLNFLAGQFVAWINGMGLPEGINAAVILVNRGEFGLILATIAASAGLRSEVVAFAGLYVLIMAVIGPIIAGQSDRITSAIRRSRRKLLER